MSRVLLDRVNVARGDRDVIRDVSLDVPTGAWVCLIGPNGAGKTTLLHALAALIPHTGSIRIGDDALSSMSRRGRARQLALVQQDCRNYRAVCASPTT